ncbi:Dyp-type peroxidase [Myxococcus sp. RHSTA-1-4]|uniref:Dyp-type peroxidase n=1 Tax=Myxococcus sp. RHSTA-1-4 TaxID=2874601 RepID=UPI001CBD638D|nr:Dyp-type peroxidase [Myxococcus sp. RHSTA-1-4]MBZ4416697.1 Dyp-type peroxidase [Myxococcus sp. RHSTA-1-4]
MGGSNGSSLELENIQSGILSARPSPYAATYILLQIEDPAAGRALMRRLSEVVASAEHLTSPAGDTWVSVALTYSGLEALGVPEESLASFAWEFRQGMAARAGVLGDTGASSPEHWEAPLGSRKVHVILVALAPETEQLERALERARRAYQDQPGIRALWRQDCHSLATGREAFGFKDGISFPGIEGSAVPGSNPHERPLKAGEFVLGYPDETGGLPPAPVPEALGRNGTYVAFRKLHQDVARFRQYLKANASKAGEEEWLAAKMMGRWRSGAPLARCPFHDDPELGGDPRRNNDFLFQEDDAIGYKTPAGSHIRRANPRDAPVAGVVSLHRMLRRGTSYGPPLPEGVLEDDGAERGLMFAFVGAHLGRQFEFVQSEWMNEGTFFGGGHTKDPIAGTHDGTGEFSIPHRPIRRRLTGLQRFVTTRGGEYAFMPGLQALRWLGDLRT